MEPISLTVRQLNLYVRSLLEGDAHLSSLTLEGELSNFKNHYSSGHLYFTLKDEKSSIKAVMFQSYTRGLSFVPENGMKVLVRGRVSVYEPSGQYQLYIEDMQPDGMGALTLAYEQLKEKLAAEGLFSKDHKKPLPQFPEKISVITSPTGAAIQDIRNVLYRRWPYADVELIPVLVQGEGSASQLKDAINKVSNEHTSDVVIIGRGGGSIEDLWSFNDEELARAIYNCSVPVISAVGHETDFTICDFVADMRAPTPSAAAELAVPSLGEVKYKFDNLKGKLTKSITDKIGENRMILNHISQKPVLKNPEEIYEIKGMHLDNLVNRLNFTSKNIINKVHIYII